MSATNGKSHKLGDRLNPIRTDHAVIDALYEAEQAGKVDFAGVMIPWIWIKLFKETGHKKEQQRTHWNLLLLFADIVFHYRANAYLDKQDGKWKLKKRFRHEWYHVNTTTLCERLGVVPEVISRCLSRLKGMKLIKLHYNRVHGGFIYQKNVFAELNLDELIKLIASASTPEDSRLGSQSGGEQIDPQVKVLRLGSQSGPTRKSKSSVSEVNLTKKTITKRTAFASEAKETKTTNNKDASRATQSGDGGDRSPSVIGKQNGGDDNDSPSAMRTAQPSSTEAEEETEPGWQALPASLEDKEIEKLTPVEKAALVRSYVGKYHRLIFQEEPKSMSARKFETELARVDQELGWSAPEYVGVIARSWLLAKFPPQKDPDVTNDPTWWSVRCMDDYWGFRALFKQYQDGRGIEMIRTQLAGLKISYRKNTLEEVERKIRKRLIQHELIIETKENLEPEGYFTRDGKKLCDPLAESSDWRIISDQLEHWKRYELFIAPEKWLDACIQRFEQSTIAEGDPEHQYYKKAEGYLA